MTRLQRALSRLDADLRALGSRWCLVGGLAVSARAEPRTTRDVDVMVVVEDDDEAEQVVAALLGRGYRAFGQLEHTDSDRLVGMRLVSPSEPDDGLVVDLLFASSGIEREVVDVAEELELLPDWPVPVARTGHLIALKLLAYQPGHPERRPMDIHDALVLLRVADATELERASRAIALITERGRHRGKDLDAQLQDLLSRRTDPLE